MGSIGSVVLFDLSAEIEEVGVIAAIEAVPAIEVGLNEIAGKVDTCLCETVD